MPTTTAKLEVWQASDLRNFLDFVEEIRLPVKVSYGRSDFKEKIKKNLNMRDTFRRSVREAEL